MFRSNIFRLANLELQFIKHTSENYLRNMCHKMNLIINKMYTAFTSALYLSTLNTHYTYIKSISLSEEALYILLSCLYCTLSKDVFIRIANGTFVVACIWKFLARR